MLSVFTVTNTDDTGVGSLRWAIDQANNTPNDPVGVPDMIAFNIPADDSGHVYYTDDGIAGSLSIVATTQETDDANISNFDPDYPGTPYSWYRIQPGSDGLSETPDALPTITDSVLIDGHTNPAFWTRR